MARPLEFLQQPPAQADPIRKQGDGRPGLRQSAILFLLLIILMCCLYIGRTCLYVLQVDRNAWLTVRWKDDLPLTGLLELFIRNNPNETNGSVTPPQPPEWLMNIENEVIEKARRAPLVDLSFLAFDSKTATTTPNGGDMRAFELATLPNSSADPYFIGSGFNSISTPEGCASRTAPTSSVSMANKPCVNETNREMKLFSNDDPWWNALHHLWPKIHKVLRRVKNHRLGSALKRRSWKYSAHILQKVLGFTTKNKDMLKASGVDIEIGKKEHAIAIDKYFFPLPPKKGTYPRFVTRGYAMYEKYLSMRLTVKDNP